MKDDSAIVNYIREKKIFYPKEVLDTFPTQLSEFIIDCLNEKKNNYMSLDYIEDIIKLLYQGT